MVPPRILIRATNWVGDAVMSLPAVRLVRQSFPAAHIALVARPWVADLYRDEPAVDRVLIYNAPPGARGWPAKLRFAASLRSERFDCAILLQNAFEAALMARVAGIGERIGYDRDARGWLLTRAVPVPKAGEIPRHERFYYLELLRRAGLAGAAECAAAGAEPILLRSAPAAREAGLRGLQAAGLPAPVVGVSPGAAYGAAKRWIPERFAEAALEVARHIGGGVAVFGSGSERPLCEQVTALVLQLADARGDRVPVKAEAQLNRDREGAGVAAVNLAGETTLARFIELAAACSVFLTNDSGAMHIACALGVPTVAVFGSTDDEGTGPAGPRVRVVRRVVDCSPCLLRECPIDHRCMDRVSAAEVAAAARDLIEC